MKKLLIVLISVLSLSYACTKSNDPQPVSKKEAIALSFDPYAAIDNYPKSVKVTFNWKNDAIPSDNFRVIKNNANDVDTLVLNNTNYIIASHSPDYSYIDYRLTDQMYAHLYIEITTGVNRRLMTKNPQNYQTIKTYKIN